MNSILQQVRAMLDGVPDDDAPVVLPKRWVLLLIAEAPSDEQRALGPEPLGGYTIKQVAEAFGRSPHRIWALVNQGLFPGAYQWMRGEYRIPLAGIQSFLRSQVEGEDAPSTATTTSLRKQLEGAFRRARASTRTPVK